METYVRVYTLGYRGNMHKICIFYGAVCIIHVVMMTRMPVYMRDYNVGLKYIYIYILLWLIMVYYG